MARKRRGTSIQSGNAPSVRRDSAALLTAVQPFAGWEHPAALDLSAPALARRLLVQWAPRVRIAKGCVEVLHAGRWHSDHCGRQLQQLVLEQLPGLLARERERAEAGGDERAAFDDPDVTPDLARAVAEQVVAFLERHDGPVTTELAPPVAPPLSRDAFLTPTQACKRLPGREAENMRWLRARGLIASRPGLPDVVIFGNLLDALLSAPESAPASTQPQPRPFLPRRRLG